MIVIRTVLPTPQENLAFDEALIEVADSEMRELASADTSTPEILRIWEMPTPCVILGRSSKLQLEVFPEVCSQHNVPVVRRSSGGSTVFAGPGCLMYSLLLSYDARPTWRSLDVAHLEVMTRIQRAVQRSLNTFQIEEQIALSGTCDLTIDSRKFSGNALRCKRNWMLYHGTLLYAMDTSHVGKFLNHPPRQPAYRVGRVHSEFVRNILDESALIPPQMLRSELEHQLIAMWQGEHSRLPDDFSNCVRNTCNALLTDKYSTSEWNANAQSRLRV